MGNSSSSKGMMIDKPSFVVESNVTLRSDPFNVENRQKRLAEGMIFGAVKGIANIGVTTVSAIADDRTYYDCPRCGREVYAYGSFVGNICMNCPGTTVSSIGSTISMTSGTDAPQKIFNSFASETTQIVTGIGGTIGNIATLQLSDGGNGTKADWCGTVIFEISKGSSSDNSSSFQSESIQSITTKSCGIGVAVFDGTGVDHWWMNVKTSSDSSGYYQVQFIKKRSIIEVRKCDSIEQCDQNGLKEANRDENVGVATELTFSKSIFVYGRSLGDLISWLESGGVSSNYSLFNNNCQDLCQRIYGWI